MPEPFCWDDQYRVDGGVIDEEHQRLFELANDVFAFEDPDSQVDEFKETVVALFDYARRHFANEEALMEKVRHPRLSQHANAHRAIVAEMTRQIKACQSLEKLAHELRCLMVDWVMRHILDEDRKITASLRRGGTAHPAPA
ncbi:MAG: hemerythrin family protein [Pirellulales bacterium]|nr:hemerythrin family protein [Pirellulales bacterium]